MQDFSDVEVPCQEQEEEAEAEAGEGSLLSALRQTFSPSEVARCSVGVEDLVVEVYSRVLTLLQSESNTAQYCVGVNETVHSDKTSQGIIVPLAGLGVHIGLSASPVPRLRVRLVKLLLDAVFQNLWNPRTAACLNAMLFWLISGRRGVDAAHTDTDIELLVLREFWPRFRRLFEELDSRRYSSSAMDIVPPG